MSIRLVTPVLAAWMLAMASSIHNETLGGKPMTQEEVTKYVNGVPIYNYQFFSKHAKKSSMNEKEATPFTTWMVKTHDEHDERMRDFCVSSEMGRRHCTWVTDSFSSFHFNGTQDELTLFLNAHNTMVEFVEPDFELHVTDRADPELPGVVQTDPFWGLDRIDDRKCLGGNYKPGLDGGHAKGIHVYVLDTGIRISHTDFGGRAEAAFNAMGGFKTCSPKDTKCAADGNGHGTHCAGIVGGKKYGVAKDVTLHAGKVLSDQGSGSSSEMIKGMDWVVSKGQKPSIISMSLGGGGRSVYEKKAVDKCVEKGVVVVVAAGNEFDDACKYTPAFVESAITVGSTANPVGSSCQDRASSFSNYGTCLDIWAPGSSITSAGHKCDGCSAVKSGTSMACPAVAGAAALVRAAYPKAAAKEVKGLLKRHATKIKVAPWGSYGNSPSEFLYVGRDWDPLTATLSVYKRMPKTCVGGANIAYFHAETVDGCKRICEATPNCRGFEYGVAYGGRGRYKPGDCTPQNSADYRHCDGTKNNLDFYVPTAVYERKRKTCVGGANIKFYHGKTPRECASICEATAGCVGFEFGVAYGGRGPYKPGDCTPQNSADYRDCDGTKNNLDFYVKEKSQSAFEENQAEEHNAEEASAKGKLLQLAIGVGAVVGVIVGITWYKSASRHVKVKPLLG